MAQPQTPTPDSDNDPVAAISLPDEPAPVASSPDPVAAFAEKSAGIAAVNDPMAALAAAVGVTDPAALKAVLDAALASQNAAHRAELDALRAQVTTLEQRQGEQRGSLRDNNESLGGYPWMYYRLPQTWPDELMRGWITIGPGGAGKDGQRQVGQYAQYLKKGMVPITKYGPCPVPTSANGADSFSLFVQNGGAVEFPASQIVAYGWHKRNPFARMGVRFPQIDVIRDQIQSWTCEMCGKTLDYMPGDQSAGPSYRAHLINADKVPFGEAMAAVRRAGLTAAPFAPRTTEAPDTTKALV